MKVEIDIPEPKFKVGAVVYRPNSKNEHGIFIHLISYNTSGEWQASQIPDTSLNKSIYVSSADYYCVLQHGSIADNPSNLKLRPGTFLVMNAKELEEVGNEIEYKDEIVSADTIKNINERWKMWKASGNE